MAHRPVLCFVFERARALLRFLLGKGQPMKLLVPIGAFKGHQGIEATAFVASVKY